MTCPKKNNRPVLLPSKHNGDGYSPAKLVGLISFNFILSQNSFASSGEILQNSKFHLYWLAFLSIALLTLILFLALYYTRTPLTKSIRNEQVLKERSPKEARFFFLNTGIYFLLTEGILLAFFSSSTPSAIINFGIGLTSIALFFFIHHSKVLIQKIEVLLGTLFSVLSFSILLKVSRYPDDLFSFCFFIVLLFMSYSMFATIKRYWVYCSTMAIALIAMDYSGILSDRSTAIYFYALLFVSIINYGRHLIVLNSAKKLLFTSNIVNQGSSLIVASDSNEQLVFISENVKEILGYEKDDLHSENWFSKTLAPGDKKEELLFKIKEAKHNGKIYSRKLLTADGNFKWFQWQYKKFGSDLWVGIGQDITEQMKIQEQYQNLIDHASDIIHKTNKDGIFTFFNRHVENLLGYTEKELIGTSYAQLIRKDYVKKVALFYNRARNNGHFETIEFPAVKKNGEEVWLSQNVTAERDHEANIVSYNAIVRDITALKMAETEKLKKQQKIENYSRILRELALTPSSNTLNLEQILKRILESSCEGVNSCRMSIWFYKGDAIESQLFYEKAGKGHWNEKIRLLRQDHPSYFNKLSKGEVVLASDVEKNEVTEDLFNDYFNAHHAKSLLDVPIFLEGRLEGVLCFETIDVFKDWDQEDINFASSIAGLITLTIESNKRKEAEQKIQESENNFRQINESIQDVFWLYDQVKRKFLYISPSCQQVLGMSAEQFYAGENYGKKYVLEEDLLHYTNAELVLATKPNYEIEYRIRGNKGEIKWINEKSTAIRNEKGELIRNSGICTDITEKKQFLNQIRQLSLVAEKTNNGVLILDRNGFAVWANESYLNTLEIPLENLLNKRPNELFFYKQQNPHNSTEAINGTNYSIAFEIQTFKENKKWLEINNTIIEDDEGNTIQQVQMVTDITQKRLKDLELAQHRAMLRKYSSNLEYQNELKEKLIHASSIEEITKVALKFVKENIKHCIHISLLTLDEKQQYLSGYFILKDNIEKERHHVKDFKSFETIKTGKMFIENDLTNSEERSNSDTILINYGAVSYVVLPLLDLEEVIGLVTITFDSPFNFNESDTESLNNFAINLSTTIQKLNLKNSLQEKNNDIRDSLNYARNIQKTMLPNLRKGIKSLVNVCLYFKPKDIVSGDFYWAKETETHLYIALGDCTGHGVPGAFLTIIGTRILEQVVRSEKSGLAAEILTELDEQLFNSLNTNQNDIIRDGMEIALCVIDKKNAILHFSGVGMGLVYFIGDEEIYLKGQRGSIGDFNFNDTAFEQTNIKLTGAERFYMASDGYQDQLGGKNYKRYSKRRLIDEIKSIKDLDAQTQESILKENLKAHMKDNFQTDDVSVLGFQIKLNNYE